MSSRSSKRTLRGLALVVIIAAGTILAVRTTAVVNRLNLTAYFANSNGVFVGDDVRILGVTVGRIERIEPQPSRVKIEFSVDSGYNVPAEANAAILSPTLVTARAIQLTPAYTSGPVMADHAVIPLSRTVVPVEWDDVRRQMQKLSEALQPTEPGGVSSLGALINTAANNLEGQGGNIRETIINLSEALSILGDRSSDLFGTVRNLSTLVSALHDSADVIAQLNQNLSAVSALLADRPNQVGDAIRDFNTAAQDVAGFVADNRATIGVTSDKLSSLSQAVTESLGDIKQTLHVAPNTLANFNNLYDPAQAGIGGAMAVNNFADPIAFICGGVQAASRLNSEQAAKLCVQYLSPIIKNRQYNFPPIGTTIGLAAPLPIAGATIRPNEITYSEDWMRPDFVPPAPPAAPTPYPAEANTAPSNPTPTQADPSSGLYGMMVPAGAGS